MTGPTFIADLYVAFNERSAYWKIQLWNGVIIGIYRARAKELLFQSWRTENVYFTLWAFLLRKVLSFFPNKHPNPFLFFTCVL